MIEKLKTLEDDEIDMSVGAVNTRFEDTELIRKINEIIDVVNGILDYAPLEMAMKAEPEPADPFTEQRQWIGCVCRFWYDNPDNTTLDYLGKIQTGENGIEYYGNETYDWFPHCEPVKPDDDIIYKGGDNE